MIFLGEAFLGPAEWGRENEKVKKHLLRSVSLSVCLSFSCLKRLLAGTMFCSTGSLQGLLLGHIIFFRGILCDFSAKNPSASRRQAESQRGNIAAPALKITKITKIDDPQPTQWAPFSGLEPLIDSDTRLDRALSYCCCISARRAWGNQHFCHFEAAREGGIFGCWWQGSDFSRILMPGHSVLLRVRNTMRKEEPRLLMLSLSLDEVTALTFNV